jgi:hypothetical protein
MVLGRGISTFIYPDFVATLIPAWRLPRPRIFWWYYNRRSRALIRRVGAGLIAFARKRHGAAAWTGGA